VSPEIILEFEGGHLRPLKPEDVHPGYVSGLNDPEVNRYLDGVKHTRQTTKSVLDFVAANEASDNAVLWGIWQTSSAQHCGTVRIHGIEHYHRTAHIGICLFDKSAWGKKLGSRAVGTLNLRWIEAGAYSENIASQKTFLAAGYEWVYDIPDKYILEGIPTRVKVYAARNSGA